MINSVPIVIHYSDTLRVMLRLRKLVQNWIQNDMAA